MDRDRWIVIDGVTEGAAAGASYAGRNVFAKTSRKVCDATALGVCC